jgi:LCP family protein required for cell wall assembly
MSSNETISDPPKRRSSKKPSGSQKILRFFAVVALIGLASLGTYIGYFWGHSSAATKSLVTGFLAQPTVAQQFPGKDSINLMIIGRDYDYTNQDVVMKSSARADLLMMAKLDFKNQQVKILSIPRDTKAAIPGHLPSKINSAEEKGGPTLTASTVLENFNIPEDNYIAVDFDGFQKAIDLLGGVDLTVDKKMDYDDNWGFLHIHLKPGYQHLNGYNAMCFVRFRHSDSDLVRTKRQQALLAALKVKFDQPNTLLALPQLINVLNDSAATDLTDNQKAALASWLKDVPKANFAMETCPSIPGSYYVYTDWPKAAPIIKNWFGVDPPAGTSMVEPAVAVYAGHHHHHLAAQPL